MVLRQLEYLDALAREGHFGRAAAACHVSQPALSTALQRLEVELGVTLIRRGHRFEGLTSEGEALVRWARAALASVDGLAAEASQLRGALAGTLKLGAIPTVAARVGEILGDFLVAQPGVRVQLSTEPTAAIVERLDRQELDAGLIYLDAPLPDTIASEPLYRDRMVLLTSDPRWTGGSDEPVTWRAASELPLCLLAPVMQNRQIVDRAFAEAGVVARPRVEADSAAALVELGLGGFSCIVGERWLRGRTLPPAASVHQLVEPDVAPTVGLITRAGPLVSPAARALREAVGGMPLSASPGPARARRPATRSRRPTAD
jgi:DNA-binding transcriptional LysR family regulator